VGQACELGGARGDRWSYAPPIQKPNGQRITPPMRPACGSRERGGKAWKEKTEIVAEGEGRKRGLVVETEIIPKTE